MAAYNVTYHFRNDLKNLGAAEAEEFVPRETRVSASDATRAQSKVVNQLVNVGEIDGKGDIKIVETKIVA